MLGGIEYQEGQGGTADRAFDFFVHRMGRGHVSWYSDGGGGWTDAENGSGAGDDYQYQHPLSETQDFDAITPHVVSSLLMEVRSACA